MANAEREFIIEVWGVAPWGPRAKPVLGVRGRSSPEAENIRKTDSHFPAVFPVMHARSCDKLTGTWCVVTLCHVLSVLYIILILRKLSCLWNLSLLPWECINLLGSIELHSIIIRLVDRSFDYVRGGSKGGPGGRGPSEISAPPLWPQKVQDKAATCQYFLLKL